MVKTCFARVFELFRKSRTNTSIIACVVDEQQNLPRRLRQHASSLQGLDRPALRRDDVSLERAAPQDSIPANRETASPLFSIPLAALGRLSARWGGERFVRSSLVRTKTASPNRYCHPKRLSPHSTASYIVRKAPSAARAFNASCRAGLNVGGCPCRPPRRCRRISSMDTTRSNDAPCAHAPPPPRPPLRHYTRVAATTAHANASTTLAPLLCTAASASLHRCADPTSC